MRRIMVADVQRIAGQRLGVSSEQMTASRGGPSKIARRRHIVMLLARRHTTASLTRIGISFNRDHTTVLSGVKMAEERLRGNTYLSGKVNGIQWELWGMANGPVDAQA